jgi:hypothetical protein
MSFPEKDLVSETTRLKIYEEFNTITCFLCCCFVRLRAARQCLLLLPLPLSLLLLLQPGDWWLLLLVQMVVWLLRPFSILDLGTGPGGALLATPGSRCQVPNRRS